MNIINAIKEKAKEIQNTIVLPETEDERVLRAAEKILSEDLAKLILIGNETEVIESSKKIDVCIEDAVIIDPKNFSQIDEFAEVLFRLRERKGMTFQNAKEILMNDYRYFGAMLVRLGIADGMVAGSSSPTADVIRASLHVIGTKKGLKTVSSCNILTLPESKSEFGNEGILVVGDCGVIPDPTASQLADMAMCSAETTKALLDFDPKVALLSFSTKGSAKHEHVDKVIEAGKLLRQRDVDFAFEDELQADAALVQAVANKKAPDSQVAGKANVLIFP